MQVVVKFTYLGNALSREVLIDNEVTAKTANDIMAFGSLRANIWGRNGNRLDTKLKVCGTANPLIGMRDLTSIQTSCQLTEPFHFSGMRKCLKTRWYDKITDTKVLKKVRLLSGHTLLNLAQAW